VERKLERKKVNDQRIKNRWGPVTAARTASENAGGEIEQGKKGPEPRNYGTLNKTRQNFKHAHYPERRRVKSPYVISAATLTRERISAEVTRE